MKYVQFLKLHRAVSLFVFWHHDLIWYNRKCLIFKKKHLESRFHSFSKNNLWLLLFIIVVDLTDWDAARFSSVYLNVFEQEGKETKSNISVSWKMHDNQFLYEKWVSFCLFVFLVFTRLSDQMCSKRKRNCEQYTLDLCLYPQSFVKLLLHTGFNFRE